MQKVVTVSQVNSYIRKLLRMDTQLNRIAVKGEISNCKYHSSGHIYFSIKDDSAEINCVMYKTNTRNLKFQMKEGQSVIVEGYIDAYEKRGSYQLCASTVTQDGTGKLYEEYEKLKERLFEEGLFDAERKMKLPKYVSKIGIVTSETGAVIQDIRNVVGRRNPYVQLILYPAKVQGEGAAEEIINGIKYFEKSDVDVIIIGRGGGSIEDLWEFNREELAYAMADCKKPIISAVGHETDFTIADWVSDQRAPTPSAAAEIAVFSYDDYEKKIQDMEYTLKSGMKNILEMNRMRLERYEREISHLSPIDIINQRKLYLDDLTGRLERNFEQKMISSKHKLVIYAEKLKGLSPLSKLQAGYSYVSDEDGNNVTSVKDFKKGDSLQLSMTDGKVSVNVEDVENYGKEINS